MSKVLEGLTPTDMERCLEDHIVGLERQRLEQMVLTIELVQKMIKPTLRGGYVSICIDDTCSIDGDASSVLFQGLGATLLAAGGTAGRWYGNHPKQRTVTLTLPSGRVIESIQRLDEVQDD